MALYRGFTQGGSTVVDCETARLGPQHLLPQAWSLRAVALLMAVAAYQLASAGLDFAEALPTQRVVACVAVLSLLVFVRQSVKPAR